MHSVSDLTTSSRRTTGAVPPKLVGASTTIVGDKMYLFGGRLVAERRMVADLYVFDLDTFVWTKLPQSQTGTDAPGARYFHSADSWLNFLVVFGGMGHKPDSASTDDLVVLNDVRFLDLATLRWLPPDQPPFPTRSPIDAALSAAGDPIDPASTPTTSATSFSPSSASASAFSPDDASLTPRARYAHLSAVSGARLYVIGGQDLQNAWLDDVCVYDLRARRWAARRPYQRHAGTYRSVAVAAQLRVRDPAREAADRQGQEQRQGRGQGIGPPGGRFNVDRRPPTGKSGEYTQTEDLVHLPYSTDPTDEFPNDIYLYSNYNFTDVKRELEVFTPQAGGAADFQKSDRSAAMTGAVLPPGLRFPTGAICGNHLIFAGTYLAHSYQSYSIWALDLTTMAWTRLDPGAALSSGSWFRAALWSSPTRGTSSLLIFGNRNGSLVEDYNRRLLAWDDVAVLDLEAFGIYQPPRAVLDTRAQELGLAALEEGLLADFELVCDDGRRIACSRRLLEERWGWFREQSRLFREQATRALGELGPDAVDAADAAPPDDILPPSTSTSSISPQRPDPRLTPRALLLSEPYAVTHAFLQYIYTYSLITPLQHAPAVLSQLLLLGAAYAMPELEALVRHAMHRALAPATSVGVYEVATLCGCQGLQIRALKAVMASSRRNTGRARGNSSAGSGPGPGPGPGGNGPSRGNGGSGDGGGGGGGGSIRSRGMSDVRGLNNYSIGYSGSGGESGSAPGGFGPLQETDDDVDVDVDADEEADTDADADADADAGMGEFGVEFGFGRGYGRGSGLRGANGFGMKTGMGMGTDGVKSNLNLNLGRDKTSRPRFDGDADVDFGPITPGRAESATPTPTAGGFASTPTSPFTPATSPSTSASASASTSGTSAAAAAAAAAGRRRTRRSMNLSMDSIYLALNAADEAWSEADRESAEADGVNGVPVPDSCTDPCFRPMPALQPRSRPASRSGAKGVSARPALRHAHTYTYTPAHVDGRGRGREDDFSSAEDSDNRSTSRPLTLTLPTRGRAGSEPESSAPAREREREQEHAAISPMRRRAYSALADLAIPTPGSGSAHFPVPVSSSASISTFTSASTSSASMAPSKSSSVASISTFGPVGAAITLPSPTTSPPRSPSTPLLHYSSRRVGLAGSGSGSGSGNSGGAPSDSDCPSLSSSTASSLSTLSVRGAASPSAAASGFSFGLGGAGGFGGAAWAGNGNGNGSGSGSGRPSPLTPDSPPLPTPADTYAHAHASAGVGAGGAAFAPFSLDKIEERWSGEEARAARSRSPSRSPVRGSGLAPGVGVGFGFAARGRSLVPGQYQHQHQYQHQNANGNGNGSEGVAVVLPDADPSAGGGWVGPRSPVVTIVGGDGDGGASAGGQKTPPVPASPAVSTFAPSVHSGFTSSGSSSERRTSARASSGGGLFARARLRTKKHQSSPADAGAGMGMGMGMGAWPGSPMSPSQSEYPSSPPLSPPAPFSPTSSFSPFSSTASVSPYDKQSAKQAAADARAAAKAAKAEEKRRRKMEERMARDRLAAQFSAGRVGAGRDKMSVTSSGSSERRRKAANEWVEDGSGLYGGAGLAGWGGL
ncbi:hypothetical protein M0805_000874 [Coniferiporia weirii]|nr:hypothetical protein M0805_000874 [Coniferiporia weirii]